MASSLFLFAMKALDQIQCEDPPYINILSDEDRILYEQMRIEFRSQDYRYNRNRRLLISKEVFEKIRNYCEMNEEDRWKRYLVCGICFYDDYIGINTSQFRFLISKSKSTINDVLSKMGYSTILMKGQQSSNLIEKIPFLIRNQNEIRKWSIRYKKNITISINKNNEKNENNDIDKIDQMNIENNKSIENIDNSISDDEEYNKKYIFSDEFNGIFNNEKKENNDLTEKEAKEESEFDDSDEPNYCIDDNFDFEFGYLQDIFSNSKYNTNECNGSLNPYDKNVRTN